MSLQDSLLFRKRTTMRARPVCTYDVPRPAPPVPDPKGILPSIKTLDFVEDMSELLFLRAQIPQVRCSRRDLDRHPLHHLETIALNPDDLTRIVGDEPDVAKTEVHKNLGADPVITEIRVESQLEVRLHRIAPFIL